MDDGLKELTDRVAGSEGWWMTIHIIKNGRVYHHEKSVTFPKEDFGPCIEFLKKSVKRKSVIGNAPSAGQSIIT